MAACVQARNDMIEACAELDEQATEDYLNGKEITNERIVQFPILDTEVVPVL